MKNKNIFELVVYRVAEQERSSYAFDNLQTATNKISNCIAEVLSEFPKPTTMVIFALYQDSTIIREHTLINYEP